MLATIHPGPIGGAVTVPPSKSIAHRTVLAAGLAKGLSRVYNLDPSQDIAATLAAVRAFGAKVKLTETYADIEGRGGFATILRPVDCGESGSTLRFLVPVLSLTGQQVEFTGRGRLFQRPMDVYRDIFAAQGLLFSQSDKGLVIRGRLAPGEYRVRGDVSSQFITGLLYALPLLHKESRLEIVPPFESRSYVQLTLDVLHDFGVAVDWDEERENTLYIPGGQRYHNRSCTVEGDYSQAAFLAVLGALVGGVTVKGLKENSAQGDAAILDILQACGARFQRAGDAVTFEKSELHGVGIDLSDCPDLGPILMVLGLFCEGETVIRNAGRLRIKESDRIAAMEEELRKFGGKLQSDENTVTIQGSALALPGLLHGHNDHRVVMALSVAALAAGYTARISGAQAVAKSWPGFFAVLQQLGAGIEVEKE